MEGTWEVYRHVSEGKEQALEVKQSLTHHLDGLSTVAIQQCL